MSQAGIITSTDNNPAIPTSFVADSGTAIPAANTLNVLGATSSTNSANGIKTLGSGSTLTVELTNRINGTSTTSGAATSNVITFPLGATPGTYTFDVSVAGFNSSTPLAAGYTIVGAVRTTGAAATLIAGQAVDSFEEGALSAGSASLVVSANNAIIQVLGTAGLNVDWNAVGTYTLAT